MSLEKIVPALRPLAVPIGSLKPDPENLRLHNTLNIEAIKASFSRFGQRKPIVVQKDGTVTAGNGSLEAALDLGWTHLAVVRVDDVPAEAKAYGIADNRSAELASWDHERLGETLKWLSDETEIKVEELGFTAAQVEELLNLDSDLHGTDYTKKIVAPIYEPKGDRPSVGSLVDLAKTRLLIKAIETAKIPDDEKEFLRLAAGRHGVFNYERIAEYYAHAPKEVQELMEASALVIIDFGKAIENGFVVLSEELAEAYRDDA